MRLAWAVHQATVREATRILNERKEAQTTYESSEPDETDPFDIEPEINDETEIETEQDDTKTRIVATAKENINNNNPTDFFFLNVDTWTPKNKLQTEVVEFIRRYNRTVLPTKAFYPFVNFLKWKLHTICANHAKYIKLTCDTNATQKSITGEFDDYNSTIFSIWCTQIRGSAAVLMADDWAK